MNRRTMLKTVALAGAASALPVHLFSQSSADSFAVTAVLRYLASHARANGGYAWSDQEHSHLTPTFAVVGCLHLLNRIPPDRKKLATFIRTHHPARLKKLEQEHRVFEFQQIQSLIWLGEDVAEFRDVVRGWKKPLAYLKQYERHGYPVFQSETAVLVCRALLGLSLEELAPHFTEYLDSRRRTNGSFNNTPAIDGGDGHVMNTWWGLRTLDVLGRAQEKRTETIAWLRQCQRTSGGFTFAPKPEFGGVADAGYTWAAVRALKLLNAAPADRERCIEFLLSLANADGGFSDRPSWLSNPLATFYVLDALTALDALDSLEKSSVAKSPLRLSPSQAKGATLLRNVAAPKSLSDASLKIFSIQLEAPGQGSPSDAVELARELKIHLWGAKNAKPEWIARAQALANRRRVPVQFFVSNEEYGTWLNVPGLGTYSHTSDIIAPASSDFGESLTGLDAFSWSEFRERRLTPLHAAGGRLIWQFGENEELVRMLLDDSIERGGFAAISTFHFGNPDFTNSEPFLQRWRGQIPFVALQDAHGNESWWWSNQLAGFRTVFIATEPTWNAWLDALKSNRVAAIRHDVVSGFKTWMHAGSREVLDFIRARESDWKWWQRPDANDEPPVALALLRPEDDFEAGRPETGCALRVRCRWNCTPHGVLKKPLIELHDLKINGAHRETELIETKNARGDLVDAFHRVELPRFSDDKLTVEVVWRELVSGKLTEKTFELETR